MVAEQQRKITTESIAVFSAPNWQTTEELCGPAAADTSQYCETR